MSKSNASQAPTQTDIEAYTENCINEQSSPDSAPIETIKVAENMMNAKETRWLKYQAKLLLLFPILQCYEVTGSIVSLRESCRRPQKS